MKVGRFIIGAICSMFVCVSAFAGFSWETGNKCALTDKDGKRHRWTQKEINESGCGNQPNQVYKPGMPQGAQQNRPPTAARNGQRRQPQYAGQEGQPTYEPSGAPPVQFPGVIQQLKRVRDLPGGVFIPIGIPGS